ncbi:hypothetical protein H0H92_013648 [Tricholoma furcatifolium]|nr:hypothetical protein H0H92_013648 [Tricholoma furcatifolium]
MSVDFFDYTGQGHPVPPRIHMAVQFSVVPFAVALSATATATGAQNACKCLQSGSLNSITASNGTLYQTGATSAWNYLNAQLQPDCIVFARDTQDVSTAMQIIFENKAQYAVQAGGHSAMQGWNNVQGGVLIHLMNMNAISYNAAAGSVTLQPGLTWGDALTYLEPYGVAVAGGRPGSDVGTGLLLGGGMSYLAPSVGYSTDTMREVDVVLVNGQVVTASATNAYSDLFRALKGGANRFGIVTRYVLDAIPTGTSADKTWYGGQLVYANSSANDVLTALAHYALNINDPNAGKIIRSQRRVSLTLDVAILLYFYNSFANGTITPVIVLNAFYNGSSTLPESVFGDFLAIPTVETALSPLSYYDAANLIGDPGEGLQMVELFGASVLAGSNDTTPYQNIYSLWATVCENFKDEIGGTTLSWTHVPQTQIDAGRARGGNAIDAPYGGFHMIQFSLSLPEGVKNTSAGLEAARQNFFATAPRTPGLPLYINESDKNQSVFPTYGGYEFLVQTYKKYDPWRFNVDYTNGPSGL